MYIKKYIYDTFLYYQMKLIQKILNRQLSMRGKLGLIQYISINK